MNQHILTQINNMPESVKTELFAYAEFLISKYKKDKKKILYSGVQRTSTHFPQILMNR